MLNAHAISRLLLDDELPLTPAEPDLPVPDTEDELSRYVNTPFVARGVPVTLYQEFSEILKGRERRFMRNLGRSTYLINTGAFIGLRYHDTYVVAVTPENRVTINSNGYHTRTTMKRINWASPGGWHLYGRKPRLAMYNAWDLFWCNYRTGAGRDAKRKFPFTDMDIIEPDGTLAFQATPDYSLLKTK